MTEIKRADPNKSLRAQPEKNPNNTQYNKKYGNAYLFPPFFFRQPRGNGWDAYRHNDHYEDDPLFHIAK